MFVFQFAEGPMVDGLYWETWYNDKNVSKDELGYIFYENKILGVARLRQLRVRNDSCTVHDDFKNEIPACYDTYAKSIEFKDHIANLNASGWVDMDYALTAILLLKILQYLVDDRDLEI